MPHRKTPRACVRRHRYRTFDHRFGCALDTWSHYHVRCRRCFFEWWQPQLWTEVKV